MNQHTAHFEWRIRDTLTQEETKFDNEEFLYWQFSTSRYYCGIKKGKGKVIALQTRCGPEGG